MFSKVYTITATGSIYEKQSGDFYYTIQEAGRIIDEDNYRPYLDWIAVGNTPTPTAGCDYLSIVNGEPLLDSEGYAAHLAAIAYAEAHPDPTLQEQIDNIALCVLELALVI